MSDGIMHLHSRSRRGITLLEVLISVGILAIGLGSIVALVPAARSQASRAVVLDRASVMAANALADAATFGLLRPEAHTVNVSPALPVVVIDPVTTTCFIKAGTNALTSSLGVYSTLSTALKAPEAVTRMITQGRDDIVVNPGVGQDDPPVNAFGTDGIRSFVGRFSCLYMLQFSSTNRLSVVVFHARDTSSPDSLVLNGSLANATRLAVTVEALAGRRLADIVVPGVVCAVNDRLLQVTSATIDSSGTSGFLTLANDDSAKADGLMLSNATVPVTILPDSVGLAERTFSPETSGPYVQ